MATKHKRAPTRRSNADRSSETRGKLIAATIEVLYRSGYAATTTLEVAKHARVSRGAMLHHFPTRVKLLLAVAQHIATAQSESRRTQLAQLTGIERFRAGADVSWQVQKEPGAIALLEITMASRSDTALRKGLAPFFEQLPHLRARAAEFMASDLGIAHLPNSKEALDDMLHIHLAALRGLAIELLFTQNPEKIENARRLLQTYDGSVVEKLLKQAEQSNSPPTPRPKTIKRAR